MGITNYQTNPAWIDWSESYVTFSHATNMIYPFNAPQRENIGSANYVTGTFGLLIGDIGGANDRAIYILNINGNNESFQYNIILKYTKV